MKFALDLETTRSGDVRLAIVIDDEVAWPHPDTDDGYSDFDPEDVVSYLADAWPSLLLSQSWSIPFEPDQEPRSITGLLRAAEERWEQLSDLAQVDNEEASLNEFLYHHDLSQMKLGAGLDSCFVLRQHQNMRIETRREVYEAISFQQFVEQMTVLGSFAVNLLKERKGDTAKHAIARWEARDQTDPISAAALVSGIPAAEIERDDDLRSTLVSTIIGRSLSDVANDNKNPIYAAARSSGALGPASLSEVLRLIQTLPNRDVAPLVGLRRRVQQDLRGSARRPTDDGIRAANFVRSWLHLRDEERFDLDGFSSKLGIAVSKVSIPDSRLDGIATNGPEHGPAIILNLNTRRQGAGSDDLDRSLRFTWAHELGHLLLDQDDWPALIDAARQRVSRNVETRANAFAASLLLPEGEAYRMWEQAGSPLGWDALEASLNRMTQEFGVPRILASRQLTRKAPRERLRNLEQVLRTYVVNYDGSGR
jgi:Zn-dependent peptidase ImmA (M78 family)